MVYLQLLSLIRFYSNQTIFLVIKKQQTPVFTAGKHSFSSFSGEKLTRVSTETWRGAVLKDQSTVLQTEQTMYLETV